jgi:rhodanese-related sulfurtransferase
MRQALHEIFVISVAAIVLGVAYTFLTNQGFFLKIQEVHSEGTPNLEMISLDAAKDIFDSKKAFFIDARHEFDYAEGHIQGAVNLVLKMFDAQRSRLGNIPKNTLLVVYCDGAECNSSIELAVKLTDDGFTNVKVFFGGWQEWKSAKFPSEKKQ